jgi:hypothetical protein
MGRDRTCFSRGQPFSRAEKKLAGDGRTCVARAKTFIRRNRPPSIREKHSVISNENWPARGRFYSITKEHSLVKNLCPAITDKSPPATRNHVARTEVRQMAGNGTARSAIVDTCAGSAPSLESDEPCDAAACPTSSRPCGTVSTETNHRMAAAGTAQFPAPCALPLALCASHA